MVIATSGIPSDNRYGWNTYRAPTAEANLPAATPSVTKPTIDWINTIASDGKSSAADNGSITYGGGTGWAGDGAEPGIIFPDGTEFARYPSANGVVLKRSPTGGGTNGGAWTPLQTVSNALDYSLLLRDPVNNRAIHGVATGGPNNWVMTLYLWNQDGSSAGSFVIPQNTGWLDGISNAPYMRAGMGADGRFVFIQTLEYWPAISSHNQQTKDMAVQILCGKFDAAGNCTLDEIVKVYDQDRWEYFFPFVGVNGDPDQIAFICGRGVRNDEDLDEKTNLFGSSTGFYQFDQFGHFMYNRRNRENPPNIRRISQRLGHQYGTCYAYVSYTSGSTSLTINEIIQGSLRYGQQITAASDTALDANIASKFIGNTWPSGTPGAVGSTNTMVTTFGGTTPITAPTTSLSRVKVKLVEPSANVSTPQKRYYSAILGNDGFIYFVYLNARHNSSTTTTLGNTRNSYRIMKLSVMGEVILDEELWAESTGQAANYNVLWQANSNNQFYMLRCVRNSTTQLNEVHMQKIFFKQSCTMTVSTTNASATVTVTGLTNGVPYLGMKVSGAGIPASSYVLQWSSFNPVDGTGTLILNNQATATATGVAVTGYALVCMEDRITDNCLNGTNGFGTNTSYRPNSGASQPAIAQTLPARAGNFLLKVPDRRSGSIEPYNELRGYWARQENDWPTATSPNGFLERIEQFRVRVQ
jgi:hypothetical protein